MTNHKDDKQLDEKREVKSDLSGLSGIQKMTEPKKQLKNGEPSPASYYLVVIMLSILCFLVFLLIVLPLWKESDKLIEYYKWALSGLLAAFGAWIGAGAAYFFGKENLKESSDSTERAMKIQQELFRRPPAIDRIKDITLTAMNPNFFFDLEKTKEDVNKLLAKFKGYWFVPVVEKDSGKLIDIIHSQVFWDPQFDGKKQLKDILVEMDKNDQTKRLHGDLFYVRISSEDKISDVHNRMSQKDAEVAIVVDEKGKPSHCLTKTDLRSFLKVSDGK